MGKALYRKFRPSSFDEVIGQDHITTTLKNSLKNGTISHAYLMSGPRGVGKTSVARLLAYAANDIAYEDGGSHLDIIEIDAASNRRIDEIRDLREKVHIAPTSGKYKVYIIDEVHMLTREAFNALLKTLEEPPAHVIFILATTEAHKLPETIVSRCLRFTFWPINPRDLTSQLANIAKSEGLSIDAAGLALIASHGEGSFRDSISLLDQIKAIGTKLSRADVEKALGLASEEMIKKLLESIAAGDPRLFEERLETAYSYGVNEANMARQIAEVVRTGLMSGEPLFNSSDSMRLLEALLDVPGAPSPRNKLELVLLDLLFQSADAPKVAPRHVATEPIVPPEELATEPGHPSLEEIAASPVIKTVAAEPAEIWQEALLKLKAQHSTLYSIARMAHAEFVDDTLTILFKFSFHFKRMNEEKNKQLLSSLLQDLGYSNVAIHIALATGDSFPEPRTPTPAPKTSSEDLTTINNIFGSHEMLES